MPIVQNNINRMNRMLGTILDQPIVVKAMTPGAAPRQYPHHPLPRLRNADEPARSRTARGLHRD